MDIRFNDKQGLLGSFAIDQTNAKIETAFSKFGDHVKSVEIYLEDVNGPKGGVDKLCRIIVDLKGFENVVVSAKAASLSKAISTSIRRSQRSTLKRIEKRMVREDNRDTDFGFAF